jgi:hypothetical protein
LNIDFQIIGLMRFIKHHPKNYAEILKPTLFRTKTSPSIGQPLVEVAPEDLGKSGRTRILRADAGRGTPEV